MIEPSEYVIKDIIYTMKAGDVNEIKKVCEKYGARYENSQQISEILTDTLKWVALDDSVSVIPRTIRQLEAIIDRTETPRNVKIRYKPMAGRALGKLVEEMFSNSLENTPEVEA